MPTDVEGSLEDMMRESMYVPKYETLVLDL